MEAEPSLFAQKLGTYMRYAEIASLILVVVAMALAFSDSPIGLQLILVGLSSLSTVYFLYAFTLPSAPGPDAAEPPQQKGFLDLLPTILRKVMYIGCSVALIALLYDHLKLIGAAQMFVIGGTALGISCLLSGLLILRDSKSLLLLRGPLYRGLPMLIISIYWMYTHMGF